MTTYKPRFTESHETDARDELLNDIQNLDWRRKDEPPVREAADLIYQMGNRTEHENDAVRHQEVAKLLIKVPEDYRVEVIAHVPQDLQEDMLHKMPPQIRDMVSALNGHAETENRDSAYSNMGWGNPGNERFGRITNQDADSAPSSNDWRQATAPTEFKPDPTPDNTVDFTEEKPDRATQFLSAVKDPANHPEEIRQLIIEQAQGDRTDYTGANSRLMGEMRLLQARRKITSDEYRSAREEFVKTCREMTEEKRQEELQVKNPEKWQHNQQNPRKAQHLNPVPGSSWTPSRNQRQNTARNSNQARTSNSPGKPQMRAPHRS